MKRPLTYGDIQPFRWMLSRSRPHYGKSLVEQLREDQRSHWRDAMMYGSSVLSDGRHIDPHDFYNQENDPMMSITMNIREIANGVLVTINNGGYETRPPEYHYPDPASAFAAAPDLLQEAWADAADRRPTHDNPLGLSSEERARQAHIKSRFYERGGSASVRTSEGQLYNEAEQGGESPVMPEVAASLGAKLPEEAAVEGAFESNTFSEDAGFMHDEPAVRAERSSGFIARDTAARYPQPSIGGDEPTADD